MAKEYLGINGLGRIGKLTLWHHLSRRHFSGFVVNTGREVGKTLDDIAQVLESDSTYGSLGGFLHGVAARGESSVKILDSAAALFEVDGCPVKILRQARNPKDVNWRKEGVRLVVETTGTFADPVAPGGDDKKGSLRGHLEAGAEKVINSAPFKIKDKSKKAGDDTTMLIYGINHTAFDPRKHHVISAASCTTTGLAHMMKPLLDTRETSGILTASMSTIHAATNTQSVLDSVPKGGAADLRKTRAAFNNIILSTTGAAQALESVLPAIKRIGFMADSVRVPTNTVSLINLNVTFHSPLNAKGEPVINQDLINGIYRACSEGQQKGLVLFSKRQNVSSDIMGTRAAVVIEGHETHTRTGFIELPAELLQRYEMTSQNGLRLPVTHAKIFGWYDNEYGSYTNCLGELTIYIDKAMG
ncbi:MAG: glyceraldehyde 3-phosphate dehydrogenase NAD-binding domain-containing protein [Elusimicrobia bacterium]|nr:glyceraldehyde 3-phosphate dehydrogenase NAD-binding domain-containing protein [Elusimicrobiota bacterium]